MKSAYLHVLHPYNRIAHIFIIKRMPLYSSDYCAQTIQPQISTTVYSQVLSELGLRGLLKMPYLQIRTKGIRTWAPSIESPAFYHPRAPLKKIIKLLVILFL